ncbi:ANTAR domain-containing protein [Nakamurella sp. YIM 132087]|uniref:ANTAR domain-containing protein n=1 Tax=Nakamurella alba TaxID=2665158 RepID=A0A7K1FLI0_9ACTN|nr:GAF and ANTAR domain-containing protein [Nakamurella alba]MTD14958.1 ANTAR domain-containing protein [Nakamurella alba]
MRPRESDPSLPRGIAWAAVMADLAREVQGEHPDRTAAAELVTSGALEMVPGSRVACITEVGKNRAVTTLAATDVIAEALNAEQSRVGAGPCLSVLWDENLVLVADLASDERWPDYSRTARGLGVRSVLAVRLYLRRKALGALSLYSDRPGIFDDDAVAAAVAYAAHATVALDQARQREQLTGSLQGREIIGQAKGILMERHGVGDQEAFRMLVQASQHANIPLRQIADRLAFTGELIADHDPTGGSRTE